MKKQKNADTKVSLKKSLSIFKHIQLPWSLMIAGLVFSLVAAWAVLQVADFSGNAVDASGDVPVSEMTAFVLTSIFVVACAVGKLLTGNLACELINFRLRKVLWSKVIATKQSVYDQDNGEGMVSRITTDCDYASKFYNTVSNIVGLVISTGMYLVGLYQINVEMANYILLFIPASFILGTGYTVLRFIVGVKTQGSLAESTVYLVERTKDLPLIKTCNAQEKEIAEGNRHFKNQYRAQVQLGYATVVSNVVNSLMEMLGIAIPFLVGAYYVDVGILTIGSLVTFNSLFGSVRGVFTNLITYAGDVKEANGALARITRFFDSEEDQPADGMELSGDEKADIRLETVTFGYTDKPVLQNLTCTIPQGKTTAVIGTNGSGKTTLFKLLCRLYEPQDGAILYGDVNCDNYSLGSWRQRLCLIAQGSPMMAGTIRENMCYGRSGAVSDEELLEVAKLSHVYDFVKNLPDGFDTVVSAGGGNFSGGQKQCIAIARAMLNKRDILLLDEATSNLDVKREKDVMEAMDRVMKDRTTVIIAHSLATIRNADHVLVIHDGKLESEGSPQDILKKTDNYLTKMTARAVQS